MLPTRSPPLVLQRAVTLPNKRKHQTSQKQDKMVKKKKTYKTRAVFVVKLFEFLEKKQHTDIISWYKKDAFVIWNCGGFTKHVLPLLFRHQNYASFVRQLHFYAFTKKGRNKGAIIFQSRLENHEPIKWQHPQFIQGATISQIYEIRRITSPTFQMEKIEIEAGLSIDRKLSMWEEKIRLLRLKLSLLPVLKNKNMVTTPHEEIQVSIMELKSTSSNTLQQFTCCNCKRTLEIDGECQTCIEIQTVALQQQILELRIRLEDLLKRK